MRRWASGIAVLLLAAGCGGAPDRLDEAAALERGGRIADATFQALATRLQQAVAQEGPIGALGTCSLEALFIVDTAGRVHGAHVRRASHRARNPADRPDAEEAAILSGYLDQLAHGAPPEALRPVVRLTGDSVHYARPILLAMPLCLRCHGRPGTDIDSLTLAEIQARYPQDAAMGHAMGDLRGIWSIRWAR